jgi:hypothetical protein
LVVDFLYRHSSIHPDQLGQVLEGVFERISFLFLFDRFTLDAFDEPLGWIDATDSSQASGYCDPNEDPNAVALCLDAVALG